MSGQVLKGWSILIAGGDAREVVLAHELQKQGAEVRLAGFEKYTFSEEQKFASVLSLKNDAVICPLPGIDDEGYIYSPFAEPKLNLNTIAYCMLPRTILLCGRMPEKYIAALKEKKIEIVITAELDEVAIRNAVPTAEGAVEIAMRESSITVHGSRSLVLGFGRSALPLAVTLSRLGTDVVVAARRRDALAQAQALGLTPLPFDGLADNIDNFDFIFNTVPALVLTEEILLNVKRSAIIIDLASKPGGTDFKKAETLGIKSILAPGLPGRVAPVSAGLILAEVYPYLLLKFGKGGDKR